MDNQQVARWLELSGTNIVASPFAASGMYESLTSRELKVTLAVAEGRSNREIASRLFISQKTVEHYLSNIFGKLGVKSQTQLALTLLRASSHQSPRPDDPGHLAHPKRSPLRILVKFIEANWGLTPLTSRSLDNLPNPVTSRGNPYLPVNGPAIGNLMDYFNFGAPPDLTAPSLGTSNVTVNPIS